MADENDVAEPLSIQRGEYVIYMSLQLDRLRKLALASFPSSQRWNRDGMAPCPQLGSTRSHVPAVCQAPWTKTIVDSTDMSAANAV